MPVAALSLRLALELTERTSLFAEIGSEYRFGSIDIYVHELQLSHIQPVVGAARLGMRAQF